MPMFQAKRLCPQAVILKPRHSYYSQVARQIRAMMEELTPLVEPLSLDEAYLDLSGTQRIHHRTAGRTMAALRARIEREIAIHRVGRPVRQQVSRQAGIRAGQAARFCGDRHGGSQKLSARQEDQDHARRRGKVMQTQLERDGITLVGQLQDADPRELARRYGATGLWLHRMANAEDPGPWTQAAEMKTISSGDHLQYRSVPFGGYGKRLVAAGRAGQRPRQVLWAWRERPWC